MQSYFLGVDIGGTKSHALIADAEGNPLGFGQGGAGNYEVVGWDGMRDTLHAITREALKAAGLERAQIAGAGFGIAGYDWPDERPPHVDAIASLGLSAPYALVNDTLIGLIAGATQGWGVGVVAGTGCNCWGRDRAGREGRVTGEGGLFAEYGGGGDLVYRAVQAISLAWSKRGPETRLTEALIAWLGAAGVEDLLEGLVVGRYSPSSDGAPVVFRVANEGDAVAQDIIRWAGGELGDLAVGVIRQLQLEAQAFEVVQIGSLYNGSPVLSDTMMETIQRVAPGARAVRLTVPPVVGAVLLAMEQRRTAHSAVRETLVSAVQTMKGGVA